MKITIEIDGKEITTNREEWEKVFVELSKIFISESKETYTWPDTTPHFDSKPPKYIPPREYPWYPKYPYESGPWCKG